MTTLHRPASTRNARPRRWFPERQLLIRSDKGTRVLRLRPLTQLAAIGGTAALFGWTILASAIVAVDATGAGQTGAATADRAALEQRLDAVTAERDRLASAAAATQQRFAAAQGQVSQMQTQILAAEQQRHELQAGLQTAQAKLQDALTAPAAPVAQADAGHGDEVTVALDILSGELKDATAARAKAQAEADKAQTEAQALAVERDSIIARNDAVLDQIQDAVSVSIAPLDQMFKSVGVDSDKLLATVREGYSGQGGPLTPLAYSSHGDAAITEGEARGHEVMVSLDKLNTYRIAAEKLPLSMPVKSAFRYTSPFAQRWGRMHEGIDMAAPVGTPIYATGDGTVIFAGRQNGYGNVIKIQHALGTETRYGHLSRINVRAGQKVSRGSRIGDMGNTGRSTGPHLHYEVRVNGKAVNPLSFIKAAQNVF